MVEPGVAAKPVSGSAEAVRMMSLAWLLIVSVAAV